MMPTHVYVMAVGSLKESYLREAAAEYRKRLGGFCRVQEAELKEARLPENPSDAEVRAALSIEAKAILAAIPHRSYTIALCVEGERFSSVALTRRFEQACHTCDTLCFVIGSSYGLHPDVKAAAGLRLSVSDLTFPHQLMRVMLYEAVYRCYQIDRRTRYHKAISDDADAYR